MTTAAAATADATAVRHARWVVARTTARRAFLSGLLWGAVFGVLILNEALGYHDAFPTEAVRTDFARSFGDNGGLAAVSGEGRQLDSLAGFLAWRTLGLLVIVGAVWGLLTSTRLLRGEEDAGRWELLLSGGTSRRDATLQAMAGLGVGWLGLWLPTAAFTVAAGTRPGVDLGVGECLFYATAATLGALLFLGVGSLTSQLAASHRQANALGAVALGVAWAIRMLADSQDGWDALRWLTPLGWLENLRPLTDPQPGWAFAVLLLVGACVGATAAAAVRRDVGAGLWGAREAPTPQLTLLESATGLGLRLERGVAVGWVISLGLLGAVFGLVARTASESGIDDELVGETVSRMGGAGAGAAAWIGYEFIYLAGILCFAAAGQISAMRNEEADGHLDHLLSRPLGRTSWLTGRLAVGLVLVVSAALAAALGGWLGVAGTGSVLLSDMLRAGFNIMVPAALVLGLGTLLLGLLPRIALPVLYAFVLWSVLGSTFGTALVDSDWIVDTAVLTDLSPVPAAPLDWRAIGEIFGIAVLAAGVGAAAFRRRDLLSA